MRRRAISQFDHPPPRERLVLTSIYQITIKQPESMQTAKGIFEVTITPQPYQEGVGDAAVGRFAIAKVFSGDMNGTGNGQMLAYRSTVQGSAGYVAMEKVQGTLNGRIGSFIMQHNGSMNRGAQQLSIKIVADSGTDQLTGIAGEMLLNIEQGKHFYEFRYTLPE